MCNYPKLRLLPYLSSVRRRRILVGRPPLLRVLQPLLPLPLVFGGEAGARIQEGRSTRLLLRVAPEARSHLAVALPLLPSREEAASEARVLAQQS